MTFSRGDFDRRFEQAQKRNDRFFKMTGLVIAVIFAITIAALVVVGFVAQHFLAKVW